MNCDVSVPGARTGYPNASDHLLNCRFIHKVIESKLIRVLKFKFVVIRQQTQQKERLKDLLRGITIMHKLYGVRNQKIHPVGKLHTFINDGKRSRCVK